jgi:hypothetical protein
LIGTYWHLSARGQSSVREVLALVPLSLNLGTGPAPTVTPPNTQTANGNPLSGGGGLAQSGGLPLPWLLNLLLGLVDKDADSIGADVDAPSTAAATGGSGSAMAASQPVQRPAAGVLSPRPTATPIPESLSALVPDFIRPVTPLFTGTSGPSVAVPFSAVMAPAAVPWARRPVGTLLIDSGVAQSGSSGAPEEPTPASGNSAPPQTAATTAPPAASAARTASTPGWQVCNAPGADTDGVVLPAAPDPDLSPADAGAAGNPEAAAAALTLALGGYWNVSPQETERRRGDRR